MRKALFLVALLFAANVLAQGYPAKPIRVVVPGAPGSTPDLLARLFTQRLGEVMNASFIIDNKPGAGGTIGTNLAMKAPADGYTLLFGYQAAVTVTPSLYPDLPYKPDPCKELGFVDYSKEVKK